MLKPRRRVIAVGVVLLLVAAGALAWVLTSRGDDEEPGRLARALGMAPEASARIGWTDWSGVREELDADLSASSQAADVQAFLDEGFSADLTSTSALVASAPVLQEQYGFSPATVDWELFAQSTEGAVLILGLPESLDLDQLEDTLEEVGYERPSDDDGVWFGGHDLLAQLGTVTQELAFITLDRERRVLVASDQSKSVESWRDDQRGVDFDDSVAGVTTEMEGALSTAVYDGDYVCTALAMTEAADSDRIRAAELIDAAGTVSPLHAYAIATLPGGDVRVAMAFESEDQARTNADTRAVLASGPAPGQGGSFPDRFNLGEVTAEGKIVTMELDPVPGNYVMSDMATGPVLFATC